MGNVFISYSHKDKEYVYRLQEDLTRQGFNVWADDRMEDGAAWPKLIQDHLSNSDVLLLVVSEYSFKSEWVQKEIERAKRISKPVVPLLLSGAVWTSIESAEVVDVMNQQLPPEKFYERLALMTTREKLPMQASSINHSPASSIEDEGPKFDMKQMGPWIVALVGAIGIVIVLWLNGTFQSDSVPAPVNTPTIHPFIIATLTPTTAVAATVSTAADQNIMLVPAGNFVMGSFNGNADEQPVHTVYLDAFYIDKYEVTNKYYKTCVDATVCAFPKFENSYSHQTYYGDSRYDNYPVVGVTWDMAKAYCAWRGGRLLTEAEWEKAARGIDGLVYPWGDSIDPSDANYNAGNDSNYAGDTSAVDAHPNGVSLYGVFDMAGNVWEWVADFYGADYYTSLTSPIANPLGATSGFYRVTKGGSWDSPSYDLRSARRNFSDPSQANVYIGFRCRRNP